MSGSEDESEPPADEQPVQPTSQPTDPEPACLIPESAHQPVLSFPQHTFGKQERAFCSYWYGKYPWLHYQDDSVLCFYCLVADKRGLGSVVRNKSLDDKFTRIGFSNWKKALLETSELTLPS